MDLEQGIAAFPYSFKECRTDIKVVQHYVMVIQRAAVEYTKIFF